MQHKLGRFLDSLEEILHFFDGLDYGGAAVLAVGGATAEVQLHIVRLGVGAVGVGRVVGVVGRGHGGIVIPVAAIERGAGVDVFLLHGKAKAPRLGVSLSPPTS